MDGHHRSPGIRVYYCRNIAYAAEIPAAMAKLRDSVDIAIEAVPCSGRIDPRYILKAFESCTRAVCILACPNGHCKRMEGNLRMTRRAQAVREYLSEAGLEPESVQVHVPTDPECDTLEAALETVSRAISAAHAHTHEVTA